MSKLVISSLLPLHSPYTFLPFTLLFSTYPLYLPLVPSLTLLPFHLTPFPLSVNSFCREEHEEITSLYLRAAQSFPDEIDSDIQVSDQFICLCMKPLTILMHQM